VRAVLTAAALALLAVVPACTQAGSGAAAGQFDPQIRVRQPAGQVEPQPGVETDINLQIDVLNTSSQTITLRRIQLATLATERLQFQPARRTLNLVIPPNEFRTAEVWVVATLVDARRSPGGGVTVRGTAIFESSAGDFRKVFTEPVVESDATRFHDRW
jgi:hypothetical protein